MHCTKIWPEFEFGAKGQKVNITGTKKATKCSILFGSRLLGRCPSAAFFLEQSWRHSPLYWWENQRMLSSLIDWLWKHIVIVYDAFDPVFFAWSGRYGLTLLLWISHYVNEWNLIYVKPRPFAHGLVGLWFVLLLEENQCRQVGRPSQRAVSRHWKWMCVIESHIDTFL